MDRTLRPRRSQKIFYGWIALAGAMLAYSVGVAISYSYGVFLPRISADMNWTRGSVSAASTLYFLMQGLPAPVVGLFIKKFGPRKSIILGGLVMALGLGSLSQMTETWHLYLGFGLITGTGWSFAVYIPNTAIANNWFSKRRALALSLVITAGGVGGLVFPPLMAWIISAVGWRNGWLSLAALPLVLSVGIAGLIVRNAPEEVGQQINGGNNSVVKNTSAPATNETHHVSGEWKVADALRTRTLWLIVVFQSAFGFAYLIMVTQQAAHLEDLGYSAIVASTSLAVLSGTSMSGRFSYGFLRLKFKAKHIACAALAGMLVGILVLINATALPLIYVYVVLFGFSDGLLLVVLPDLLPTYYGRALYPQLVGWIQLIHMITAAGPWIAGTIQDTTGSYVPAFTAMAILLAIGLACAVTLRPPKPPSRWTSPTV